MNQQLMQVSVVIPTYNRFETLRRTLAALACQSFPMEGFDVWVIDDGSTDATPEIAREGFPFTFRYARQQNAGATAARNFGACQSEGNQLVFLDDDIELAPQALAALVEALERHPKTIVLGALQPYLPEKPKPFSQVVAANWQAKFGTVSPDHNGDGLHPSPFTECKTGILAISRPDFLGLGMFQDPTGGWPNWDDVDFGYRAQQAGYCFLRCTQAAGIHHDYALQDLKVSCRRVEQAARSAALLYSQHPDLFAHLSMFHDKTPIAWDHDSPVLILHKLVHSLVSSRYVLPTMEGLARFLEEAAPATSLLRPLYRWINSSYIYRGYRQGLYSLQIHPSKQ